MGGGDQNHNTTHSPLIPLVVVDFNSVVLNRMDALQIILRNGMSCYCILNCLRLNAVRLKRSCAGLGGGSDQGVAPKDGLLGGGVGRMLCGCLLVVVTNDDESGLDRECMHVSFVG